MTKAELIASIATKLEYELTTQQLNTAVRVILDTIIDAVSRGERVEIRGIGTFSKRLWGPRHARNPYTKKSWMTQPRAAIHFKASKGLRDNLNTLEDV
jgi:integration host factor subunit beta